MKRIQLLSVLAILALVLGGNLLYQCGRVAGNDRMKMEPVGPWFAFCLCQECKDGGWRGTVHIEKAVAQVDADQHNGRNAGHCALLVPQRKVGEAP